MLIKIIEFFWSIILILIIIALIILVIFGVQYFMKNILWILLLVLAALAWVSAIIHLLFFNQFLTPKQKVSWMFALFSFIFTGIAIYMYWGQWHDNSFEVDFNKKNNENIR